MLGRAVHPALFWCAGSWNLRANQLPKLRNIQNSMLRKMLQFRRHDSENMDTFMHRTGSIIENIKQRHDLISLDCLYHRSCFRWADKLLGISAEDPDRSTLVVFKYKDYRWIENLATS